MRISGEKYEHCIDDYIYSAYVRIPEPEDVTDSYRIQDWILVKDIIREHVASTYARLDGKILDAALSDWMEFSKFSMAIGSMTANSGSCEFFEADMEAAVSQTRAEIGSTTAGHPKGFTAEMLSKIWTIPYEMAEKTLRVMSQLNRQGENTSLARNLGTNDCMLRYRQIKSHFSLAPFLSQARREARGSKRACRFLSPIRVLSRFILRNHRVDTLQRYTNLLRMMELPISWYATPTLHRIAKK